MAYILLFPPPTDGPSTPNMWVSFGPFFYILIVLFVIVFVCWLLLRLTGVQKRAGLTAGNLQLKESIFIGAQNMVQLVRAGDKYLVLGVNKERVTLLAELTEEQIKEAEALPPISASFGKVLERFLLPKDETDDGEPRNENRDENRNDIK